MIRYRERPPAPPLAPYVRCLWSLAARAPEALPLEPLVPDGCSEWVFHLATPFARLVDGAERRQAAALVVGLTTGPVWLRPSSDADVVGVRFRPGGMGAFVAGGAERWRDALEPAEAADVPGLAALAQRLGELPGDARGVAHDATSGDARWDALEAFLLQRLARARPRRRASLAGAVDLLLGGRCSVDHVALRAGIGARQLERRFLAEVGVGPKALARIGRLQRALRALGDPRIGLAEVAARAGYADQSHLGRELRELGGTTPARYRARACGLQEAFLGGEEPGDVAFLLYGEAGAPADSRG